MISRGETRKGVDCTTTNTRKYIGVSSALLVGLFMEVDMIGLCHECKRPLGTHWRCYTDDVNGLTYRYHFPTCWETVKRKVVEEYCWLIYRAKEEKCYAINAVKILRLGKQ